MKKILVIIALALALVSCVDSERLESSNGCYIIFADTIKGHEYIIMDGYHSGNIIHSASCPCKKGGEE